MSVTNFAAYDSLSELPESKRPTHLAIGIFDGVHLGHQSVLEACRRAAKITNGRAGVLTFSPHPSRLFRPDQPTLMLHYKSVQQALFEKEGLDFSIIETFTREFAEISDRDFLQHIKQRIHSLAGVYVGENFRFGKGRAGDISTLVAEGKKIGVSVVSADRIKYNGLPISSTRIREQLTAGNIHEVNQLLGYQYFVKGVVTAGKQLGRKINFPTVNLPWAPELAPRFGVYKVSASFGEKKNVLGVANYGMRPTVEDEAATPILEVHFKEDPTLQPGDSITVEWLEFIRPEKKFANIDELKKQISKDLAVVF